MPDWGCASGWTRARGFPQPRTHAPRAAWALDALLKVARSVSENCSAKNADPHQSSSNSWQTHNPLVAGSSPARPTNTQRCGRRCSTCWSHGRRAAGERLQRFVPARRGASMTSRGSCCSEPPLWWHSVRTTTKSRQTIVHRFSRHGWIGIAGLPGGVLASAARTS